MNLFKHLLYSNLIIGTLNAFLVIEIVYQVQFVKSCSKSRNYGDRQPKIVGGTEANIEEVPYIAAILGKTDMKEDGYDFLCAAVIVSASCALTANHCVEIMEECSQIKVISGSTFWQEKGTEHDVVKTYTNEDFKEDTLSNDIAILVVEPHFTQKRIVSVAGKNYNFPDGSTIQVTGWGETNIVISSTDNATTTYMDRLYTATLNKINTTVCVSLVNAYLRKEDPGAENFVLDDTQFCGRVLEDGKDACVYDSGGPAVHNNVLVGIVSSGAPVCGTKGYPGIYVNLRNLHGWLNKMSKKLKMQIKFVG